MNRAATAMTVVLVALQLVDIAVHLATGQVEVIRIVASTMLIAAAVVTVTRRAGRSIVLVGTLAYLALNVVFIVDAGLVNPETGAPRIVLFVFVALSVAAALALMATRRRTAH